jgi:hypothetical protein
LLQLHQVCHFDVMMEFAPGRIGIIIICLRNLREVQNVSIEELLSIAAVFFAVFFLWRQEVINFIMRQQKWLMMIMILV